MRPFATKGKRSHQRVEKLVFDTLADVEKSEMKFVSLCAEAYVDTPSRDWQKHKIAVISVKNGDFLIAYACIFLLLKTI